jgi:glycosyltransferase involved in cell wall biosynthesis
MLSAVIITYNEGHNIGRCIDSLLPVVDEIIVLDSFSGDDTAAIAKSKGAIVHQQRFLGYKQQKNAVLSLAHFPHVISLDADEVLSDELIASIHALKKTGLPAACCMNRCNIYCGKPIRRGLWYPDRKLRLFDKRVASWVGFNPHDRVQVADGIEVQYINGDIMHYAFESIAVHRQKNEKISSLVATSMLEAGLRPQPWKMIVNPLWSFINGYFLRHGILDGYLGFMIAWLTAQQSYKKHQQHYRQFRAGQLILETKYNSH